MARTGQLVGGLFVFGLLSSACGSSNKTGGHNSSCTPGAERCSGQAILRCDESGTRETIVESCPAECRAEGSVASCVAGGCAADSAVCDGSIATKCKRDGSGPLAGGTDCALTQHFCVAGACRDTLCTAGTKSCQGGDLYLCAEDGQSLALVDDCAEGELCSEMFGACVARFCEPDKSTCYGTRVATCNSVGSDWLSTSTDCAAQGKACVDGACVKRACIASTTFCQDGDIHQCDVTGSSSTVSKACRRGFDHCELSSTNQSAKCVADTCVAGQMLCDGNVIKVCNDDGSRPATGTPCAKNEACENASCRWVGCVAGSLFCSGTGIFTCGVNGPKLDRECDSGSTCLQLLPDPDPENNAFPDLIRCMPLPCPAGQTGCVLNKVGTCGADGSSLEAVTSDCTESGQVCTTTGTCSASVTDTLGKEESSSVLAGNAYVGNVIEVHSPRKLTELQMWLVFSSPRDLRWLVFEQVGTQFVARAEKTSSVASSAGFVGSGPLSFDYRLEAGKRYALGVVVPGGAVSETANAAPELVASASFGSVIGSVTAYNDFTAFEIPQSFTAYAATYAKVTTESP